MQGFDLLVDMLAVEPLIVLNAAFCELHRKRCPPSEQLLRECAYVSSTSACLLKLVCTIACGLMPNFFLFMDLSWQSSHAKVSCVLYWSHLHIMRKSCKELGRRIFDSARMQAEQMMRDFDSIMIPLQLNLTSQGRIDKDVSIPRFKPPAPCCPFTFFLLGEDHHCN